MIPDWMTLSIYTAAKFGRYNIDPDTACFLKSEEAGHVMKSPCVEEHAPQALPYDWRFGK